MRVQPVAAAEVADALVALALGPPVGMAPELAGPEEHDLVDLACRLVRASGQRRAVVGVRLPGAAGRGMASGALLPTGGGPRGRVTFPQWLASASVVGATTGPRDGSGGPS